MAQEVQIGQAGTGRVRSFAVGLGLTVITFSIYYFFWYYLLNDELKDVGIEHDDEKLAQSSPAASLAAVLIGGVLIVPPMLSVYNFGHRIKRAERLVGVPQEDQLNPTLAFLTWLFGFLVLPAFYHYWYITKHQNQVVRAIGGLDYRDRLPVPPPIPQPQQP